MILEAPAHGKINWFLHVGDRFPVGHKNAGFTEICSAVVQLELHDTVQVEILDRGACRTTIIADREEVPQEGQSPERNSAHRAATVLRQKIPALADADLTVKITKRLPLGGGLGGSSTDGAAVLRLLIDRFAPEWSVDRRNAAAAEVGSDVSLFMSGGPVCLMAGRGEIVTPEPTASPDCGLVLVNPGLSIESRDVYAGLSDADRRSELSQGVQSFRSALRGGDLELLCESLQNDLERSRVVVETLPFLAELKQTFLDLGCLGTLLAGSGSTVFGVAPTLEAAQAIADQIAPLYPGFSCTVSRPLRDFHSVR